MNERHPVRSVRVFRKRRGLSPVPVEMLCVRCGTGSGVSMMYPLWVRPTRHMVPLCADCAQLTTAPEVRP